jgi:CHASE3 domain sensor protein
MLTAEFSERGFIITGNEIYLGPYQSAKSQAQRNLSVLQALLPSYTNSDLALRRLSAILTDKFDELDRTIELKRIKRDDEVLAIIRTNSGKALTDEANVFLSGVIVTADDRLTSGVAEQQANTGWLRLVSGIGALVIIAVVSSTAMGIANYTKELRETRDEVNTLNVELELRVSEVDALNSELEHRVANRVGVVRIGGTRAGPDQTWLSSDVQRHERSIQRRERKIKLADPLFEVRSTSTSVLRAAPTENRSKARDTGRQS